MNIWQVCREQSLKVVSENLLKEFSINRKPVQHQSTICGINTIHCPVNPLDIAFTLLTSNLERWIMVEYI